MALGFSQRYGYAAHALAFVAKKPFGELSTLKEMAAWMKSVWPGTSELYLSNVIQRHHTLRFAGLPLLDAYRKTGKPAEADRLLEELLADARKTLPKDSPQLAERLAQLGLILLEMKQFAEAEQILREYLAIQEKDEPNDWQAFGMQSWLGGRLLGQKKYADAEPLLLKGYEGIKQREKSILPQGATSIPKALDRLIELYSATNRPDEVKKWQAERAKYPAAKKEAAPEKN